MKFRTIVFLSIAVLLLVATSTVLVIPAYSAPAAQAGGNNGPVTHRPPNIELEAASTYAYWTPERMAAAQPMPLKEATGTGLGVAPSSMVQPDLHPGFAPGNLPGEAPAAMTVPQLAGIQPVAAVSNYYTYPFPSTYSFMGGGLEQLPTPKTMGKLFFTQNGTAFVCSGTVVTGGSGGTQRLISTAGHCIHDGSNNVAGYSSNLLFCPAYWNGSHPWGCWGWSSSWTTSQWFQTADLRYDHGFIVANHSSNTGFGEIAAVIGSQGEAWGLGSQQDIWSFGYPAESPFDGTIQVWTTSSVAQIDDAGGGPPYTWGIGSSQTGGASGGAWLINARFAAMGFVVSHNDYKYTSPSMPLAMFGPPQDSTVWLALYNSARVDNP